MDNDIDNDNYSSYSENKKNTSTKILIEDVLKIEFDDIIRDLIDKELDYMKNWVRKEITTLKSDAYQKVDEMKVPENESNNNDDSYQLLKITLEITIN